MREHIDELMATCKSDITKAVTAGIGLAPTLERYLAVEVLTEPPPFRVESVAWHHEDEGPDDLMNSTAFPGLEVTRCSATLDYATKLTVSLVVAASRLTDSRNKVLVEVKKFAESARLAERHAVLRLVGLHAGPTHRYELKTIEEEVTDLGPPCRLIGRGEIAEAAKKAGIVDSVVDPQGALPVGTDALLIRLRDGPTVRRVVDDLQLTWIRERPDVAQGCCSGARRSDPACSLRAVLPGRGRAVEESPDYYVDFHETGPWVSDVGVGECAGS